eukprot:6362715-Amphidinium_carterae.1
MTSSGRGLPTVSVIREVYLEDSKRERSNLRMVLEAFLVWPVILNKGHRIFQIPTELIVKAIVATVVGRKSNCSNKCVILQSRQSLSS